MKLAKKIYYRAAQSVPLSLLVKMNGDSSVFPYHHIVSDEVVPHIAHLYPYKNKAQFSSDIDFLLRHYKPIHPDDLVQHIRQHGTLPKRRFLFTFDDGFREAHEVIAPILKAKGIPAIFFINPAYIDNRQMFYRNKISLILGRLKSEGASALTKVAAILNIEDASFENIKKELLQTTQDNRHRLDAVAALLQLSFDAYLKSHRPWLTTTELQTLAAQGFTIGAHSWDHAYYQKLPVADQIKQTTDSCNFIRRFAQQPTTFSFPHSDKGLTQDLFNELLQPGAGIDLLFGIQNQKRELHHRTVHRFNAERPSISLQQQLPGLLLYNAFEKLIRNHSIIRSYA